MLLLKRNSQSSPFWSSLKDNNMPLKFLFHDQHIALCKVKTVKTKANKQHKAQYKKDLWNTHTESKMQIIWIVIEHSKSCQNKIFWLLLCFKFTLFGLLFLHNQCQLITATCLPDRRWWWWRDKPRYAMKWNGVICGRLALFFLIVDLF